MFDDRDRGIEALQQLLDRLITLRQVSLGLPPVELREPQESLDLHGWTNKPVKGLATRRLEHSA